LSNFVSISRTNGSINQLSLLVEDISSLKLLLESSAVQIFMRSGKEFTYSFDSADKAVKFYALLSKEIEASGRKLTELDVDDFDN